MFLLLEFSQKWSPQTSAPETRSLKPPGHVPGTSAFLSACRSQQYSPKPSQVNAHPTARSLHSSGMASSSAPLPPFDNPSWKALQARTAHLTREGYFTTPLRAARSSSSGNSFLPTICSLNVSISASASFRLLPDSRSVIIEAEAWEMAQPRPLNLTSVTLSPSKAA